MAAALLAVSSSAMDRGVLDRLLGELENNKFENSAAFLAQNRATMQKDPDYHVLLLNYALLSEAVKGERRAFRDSVILDAIRRTQGDLRFFPDRLDIHFGIVAVAERVKRWDLVGEQIVSMLKVSREIDNRWKWGPVGATEDPSLDFMMQNILNRTGRMFDTQSGAADSAFERTARALIKYYPGSVYGYSNLAVMHMSQGRYDEAEKDLKLALARSPHDELVRANLKWIEKKRGESRP